MKNADYHSAMVRRIERRKQEGPEFATPQNEKELVELLKDRILSGMDFAGCLRKTHDYVIHHCDPGELDAEMVESLYFTMEMSRTIEVIERFIASSSN